MMEQRSDNWLQWRRRGLGGSDAPILMGVSPWKTPYQLWEDKCGLTPIENKTNFAQARGNTLEPIARAKYELEVDFEMSAATFQHFQLEFILASMDGFNPKAPAFGKMNRVHKRGLEIKCPGEKDHATAVAGKIPEKYFPQLMHQFIATGADVIDYYSYWVKKGQQDHEGHSVRIEVLPDMDYIKKYIDAATKFWECVKTKTPPPFCDDDYRLIRSVEIKEKAEAYKHKKIIFENAKHEFEIAEDLLLTAIGDDIPRARIENTGVEINTVNRVGAVNYKKIPELKGVDLEQYRGEGTSYKKILIKQALKDRDPF